VPFGVPRLVGPSQPVPAWHQTDGEHAPFESDVTSIWLDACRQVYAAGYPDRLPPSACTDATIGEHALG
jgi:hypothetical protein